MTGRWQLPSTLVYVECDIPPGMTIADYRARRAAAKRRPGHFIRRRAIGLLFRLASRLGGVALRVAALLRGSGLLLGGQELPPSWQPFARRRALGRPSVARVRVRFGRRRAPRRAAPQSEGGRV